MNPKPNRSLKYCLALVIGFFVSTTMIWVVRDTNPMPVLDCYTQASKVLQAIDMGFPITPRDVLTSMTTLAQDGRPPLYQLTTIPVILLFGRSEDAFTAVNLLYLVLLTAGVYGVTRTVSGRMAGLVSVIVVAGFPPMVHFSHQYRSYYGAFAAIAVTLFFLALCLRDRRVGFAWAAAGSCALALLMHPIVIYVLIVPMASTWIWGAFGPREGSPVLNQSGLTAWLYAKLRDPYIAKGLLPATALPLLVMWIWYLHIGRRMMTFFSSLKSGWLSEFRGTEHIAISGTVPPDLLWLPLTSPQAISTPLAAATLLAAVVLLFRGTVVGRFLVVWLFSAFALLETLHSLSWSYGAFALPLAAAVLGAGTAAIPQRALRWSVFVGLVGVSGINYSIVNWGGPRLPPAAARFWGVVPGPCDLLLCPHPANSPRWPIDDVVAAIATGGPEGRKEPVAVFTFTPGVNPGVFDFTRMRYWPRTRVQFSSQKTPRWGSPYPVPELVESEWKILQEPLSTECRRRSSNPFWRATACFLESPPAEFEKAHRVERRYQLPNGGRLTLLRRTAPVTMSEIDSTVASIDLPPKFTTRGAVLAALLLEEQGQRHQAIERLDVAAAIEGQPPAIRADILSLAGTLHIRDGEVDLAVEKCRAAVAVAPSNVVARIRLGVALAHSGRFPEAKKELREASRRAPGMAWPREELRRLESHESQSKPHQKKTR